MGWLLASSIVTVTVDEAAPFARTIVGLATIDDWPAQCGQLHHARMLTARERTEPRPIDEHNHAQPRARRHE